MEHRSKFHSCPRGKVFRSECRLGYCLPVILSISCITELIIIVFQSGFDYLVHIIPKEG